MKLRLAAEALERVELARAWWRSHRSSAPDLFDEELVHALGLVLQMPSAGSYYRVIGGVSVRRVLLPRTRYAVYYSLDADAEFVTVHSVWSTLRGRGPKL